MLFKGKFVLFFYYQYRVNALFICFVLKVIIVVIIFSIWTVVIRTMLIFFSAMIDRFFRRSNTPIDETFELFLESSILMIQKY